MATEVAVTKMINPLYPRRVEFTPPAKKINHIALVVDQSGSMGGIHATVKRKLKDQIQSIRDAAIKTGQQTLVSLYFFEDEPVTVARGLEPALADHYNTLIRKADEYAPYGNTALHDAVNHAISDINALSSAYHGDNTYLVIVITDGQENHSKGPSCVESIRIKTATDRWSFAFSVPHGYSRFTEALGVPKGNIQEWDGTQAGFERVTLANVAATQGYFTSRAAGKLSTKSFYTDLSGVTARDLNKLDDLSGSFKHWKVDRECPIQAFVEAKGVPYELGKAYYQLTKREEVQSHKDVLIKPKDKFVLYGGSQAKDLIGIASGPGVVAKVTPGNHANYDIFVQSTSTNRKLVRGTTLLYKAH